MKKIKEIYQEWINLIPKEVREEMIRWTFYILLFSFGLFMGFIISGLYIKGIVEFYQFLGINPESQVIKCK